MPLAERDVNAQHNIPRNKRQSTTFESLPGSENAALAPTIPRAKETPRQQRFLAPTKASSAKTTPPTLERKFLQPHSGRSTPQPLPQTLPKQKLPHRTTAAPALAPPTSKWSVRRDINTNSLAQKSIPASKSSPLLVNEPDIAQVQFSVSDAASTYPSTADGHHAKASSYDLAKTSRRPLSHKPLPSRPFATSICGPSPSKDSRCLLDATEKPLRRSIGGIQHEWPALTPSPSTTPIMDAPSGTPEPDNDRPFSPSGRRSFSNTSMIPTISALPRAVNTPVNRGRPAAMEASVHRRSSLMSYVSAAEDTPTRDSIIPTDDELTEETTSASDPSRLATPSYPPRKSSLNDSPTYGSPYVRDPATAPATVPGFMARKIIEDTMRPTSPSPANFSRLRPGSFSQSSGSMITPIKTQKTASRIPIPDPKKATLVDVKSRQSSGIPTPKMEKGLNFAGRRIDSPDPLKILDHGTKRRQLTRADTNGSSSTASTVPTKVLNTGSASRSQSKVSFPGSTTGESSEEDEEVTTPYEKSQEFPRHHYAQKHLNRTSGSHYGGATLKVYDEAEIVLGRPPPSNSPFTGPLQTIHSQSTLPRVRSRSSSDSKNTPKVVIKPTEFTTFANRLSQLQSVYGSSARNSRARYSVLSTRSELVDVLKEAEHEDALVSQCGVGLDEPTKEDITRTLSMLEGKSGPTITAVDPDELARMLGRLRLGFQKAPKSAAFIEDATVAERFLQRSESSASEAVKRVIMAKANGASRNFSPRTVEDDSGSRHSVSRIVASKWSFSTPSEKDLSLTLTNNDTNLHTDDYDGHLPTLPLKDAPYDSVESIGYPSRIHGKAQRVLGSDERSTTTQKTSARRVSSPTLGRRVPGSVRIAREKAHSAAVAANRNVLSGKIKGDKMPTPNTKVYDFGSSTRGRTPSAEKLRGKGATPKTPRSQSRKVLDKLNGLFTGKREKRDTAPPVPPMKDHKVTQQLIGTTHVRGSTMGSHVTLPPSPAPQPKMPTWSPPVEEIHPALRTAVSPESLGTTLGGTETSEPKDPAQIWSEKLHKYADKERNLVKKERILTFAKVLSDSFISAREAHISAETAQSAARSAQLSYEMTQRSVVMLERLAHNLSKR